MNTQTQNSDTKVSKETAKVLDALAKWSALFDSLADLEKIDGEFQHEFYPELNDIRDRLNDKLLSSIC